MQRPAILLVAVLAAVPIVAAGIPRSSQPRAERMADWRAKLHAADYALHRERPEEAERLYREVIDDAAKTDEESLLVARAVDGMADLCRAAGRFQEAVEYYRRAAAMWEPLLGPRQPREATTLHNLAVVEAALGEIEAAQAHLLEALDIWEASLGPDSPQARTSRAVYHRLTSRSNGAGGAD
jgi:tetratricopeptide (TPR) repeat protein